MNCGVTYWQNAAPDGPALWVIATLVDRVLRCEGEWALGHGQQMHVGSSATTSQIKLQLVGLQCGCVCVLSAARCCPACHHDGRMWEEADGWMITRFGNINVADMTWEQVIYYDLVRGNGLAYLR